MKKIKLILVRHGESVGNEEHRLCGTKDVELTSKGRWQVKLAAIKLKSEKIDLIISSPLKRAKTTASYIADAQNYLSPISISDNLIEMNFGIAEGMKKEEYESKYKKPIWDESLGYPANIEKQESFLECKNRYIYEIEKILKQNRNLDTICIVGHGMGIRAFMSYILGKDEFHLLEVKFSENSAITILEYNYDKDKYKILLEADISHLN